jgi:hypothetical protein
MADPTGRAMERRTFRGTEEQNVTLSVSVVDTEPPPRRSEAEPVLFRCRTVAEAEAFIRGIEYISPFDVHRGRYAIDSPE